MKRFSRCITILMVGALSALSALATDYVEGEKISTGVDAAGDFTQFTGLGGNSNDVWFANGAGGGYWAPNALVEVDPIWTGASNLYYLKTQSDALYYPLTGNPSGFAELGATSNVFDGLQYFNTDATTGKQGVSWNVLTNQIAVLATGYWAESATGVLTNLNTNGVSIVSDLSIERGQRMYFEGVTGNSYIHYATAPGNLQFYIDGGTALLVDKNYITVQGTANLNGQTLCTGNNTNLTPLIVNAPAGLDSVAYIQTWQRGGTNKFTVDGDGNVIATGSVTAGSFSTEGNITRADEIYVEEAIFHYGDPDTKWALAGDIQYWDAGGVRFMTFVEDTQDVGRFGLLGAPTDIDWEWFTLGGTNTMDGDDGDLNLCADLDVVGNATANKIGVVVNATNRLDIMWWAVSNRFAAVQVIGDVTNVTFISP